MKILKHRSHATHTVVAPEESVTMIDRELQRVIVQLNQISGGNHAQRKALLSQLDLLKRKRKKAIQPKTYDRMLASLG